MADLQNANGAIEAAAGLQLAVPTLSVRPDGEPLQILMMLTSPNLFELLGVAPILGRGFAADEVGPNRPSVIVMPRNTPSAIFQTMPEHSPYVRRAESYQMRSAGR